MITGTGEKVENPMVSGFEVCSAPGAPETQSGAGNGPGAWGLCLALVFLTLLICKLGPLWGVRERARHGTSRLGELG